MPPNDEMRKFLRLLYPAALILAILFSLYSMCFLGWVSATPITPEYSERVRTQYYAWMLTLVILLVLLIRLLILFFFKRKS